MKNKKVGTISMGILLIAFGILVLIAQFNKLSALSIIVKLWPSILIVLGIEILYAVYESRKKEFIIGYDIFSLFLITTVLFINVMLYGFVETGVMDYMKIKISNEIEYMTEDRERIRVY